MEKPARDVESFNEIDAEVVPENKIQQESLKLLARQQTVETTSPKENNSVNSETSSSTPPQQLDVLNWLTPLLQRWQFTPQIFFKDRLNQLKQSLGNLGFVLSANNATAKQLSLANGLLQLAGINDSGFYTDRLEPAGFLGGNGWFANKGGILGGPGAILSTGSILTDYQTPYRK